MIRRCSDRSEHFPEFIRFRRKLLERDIQRAHAQLKFRGGLSENIHGFVTHRVFKPAVFFSGKRIEKVIFDRGYATCLEAFVIALPFCNQAAPRRNAENRFTGTNQRMFAENFVQEFNRSALLIPCQGIGFVENEKDACRLCFETEQVIELDFGDRRIGRQHKECGVAFGQHLHRCLSIVLERRTDAGRVDEHRSVRQNACGIKQLDMFNAQMVLRVGLFGDETKQNFSDGVRRWGGIFLFSPVALEVHDDERGVSPDNKGRDCGQRNYSGGQEVGSEQRVDKCTLAALELAENGNLQAFLIEPLLQHAEATGEQRCGAESGFEHRIGSAE